MTNKELIEILHNIPEEVFQNKNHEKLHVVFYCEEPGLKLLTSNDYTVLSLNLYYPMQYEIWSPRSWKDIKNQVKSYLNILGFTELYSTSYTTARYTPELGVAVNSMMTDTEIMKLMQYELNLEK